MKKLTTIVLCMLAIGIVGCSKQKQPEKYAERDYNIAAARAECPGGAVDKFGNECSANNYK